MPIRSATSSKPPPGTPLEPSRPLAQGLIAFCPMNEGTGLTLVDAAGRLPLAQQGLPPIAAAWAAGPSGIGLNQVRAGTGFQATIPAALQVGWPQSIAFAARFGGAGAAGNARVWGAMPNNNNTAPFVICGAYTNASGLVFGGSNSSNYLTFAFTPGVDYVFSFSLNGTPNPASWAVYVNGQPQGSGAGAAAVPGWGTTPQLVAGGWTAVSSASPLAPLYWGAWWSRTLTAAEHAAIGASPTAIHGLLLGQPAAYRLINPAAAALLSRRTLYGRAGSRGVA